ncbi:MAG: hypothetical protein A4E38_01649 [Methanoregulaceae archaeon PtaB.Bin108]|nr:MAG: hypothetical protein A4E38_01649 [Methanoregulaceae archaeon PtaB.Bin108]
MNVCKKWDPVRETGLCPSYPGASSPVLVSGWVQPAARSAVITTMSMRMVRVADINVRVGAEREKGIVFDLKKGSEKVSRLNPDTIPGVGRVCKIFTSVRPLAGE